MTKDTGLYIVHHPHDHPDRNVCVPHCGELGGDHLLHLLKAEAGPTNSNKVFLLSQNQLSPKIKIKLIFRLKSAAAAKGEKENVVALGGYLTVII